MANRDGGLYVCLKKGCVRVTKSDLDELAEGVMLAYLARPDVIENLRSGDEQGGRELSKARDSSGRRGAQHEQLVDAVGAGRASVDQPSSRRERRRIPDQRNPRANTGVLRPREWETTEGDKRYAYEVQATEVGVSLHHATVQITGTDTSGGALDATGDGS